MMRLEIAVLITEEKKKGVDERRHVWGVKPTHTLWVGCIRLAFFLAFIVLQAAHGCPYAPYEMMLSPEDVPSKMCEQYCKGEM